MKSIISKKNTINNIKPSIIYISILSILIILSVYLIYNSYQNQYHNQYQNQHKNQHTYTSNEDFADLIMNNFEYMAPPTDNITDELWKILYNKMINVGSINDREFDKIKNKYTNFITKEEISYYLDNGYFPWNSHVKKIITDFINESITNSGAPLVGTVEDLLNKQMSEMPNRYTYSQYLLMPMMKESITSDAYLIYSGDKAPPPK